MWNIKLAQRHYLQEIITLNKIDDYGNPDSFIEECILSERVEVVLKDKKVVAFSLYQIIWGNTVFLALVKVHPDYQWNWIGTSLVKSFEDKMRSEWHTSYLSSTEKINILSQNFTISCDLPRSET